jgi:large subunit ribosomal protein L30
MKFSKRESRKGKRGEGLNMEKTIRVKWIKSAIGKPGYQMKTVRGLGFTRLNQVLALPDEPAIRGMVNRVCHLVKVIESPERERE